MSAKESPLDRRLGRSTGRAKREGDLGRARKVHPYAWLWEPLEQDATFVLAAMFGTRVVYLDGRLALCFAPKEEPWRGVLVCTEREHQASLVAEFPSLAPHAILPKWLYLPESADDFERTAERLVVLAGRRDPRIGVASKHKRPKRAPRT
ncbi:MAG TPA: hypothetical protein VII43_03295 [Opitutaceae bacterium]